MSSRHPYQYYSTPARRLHPGPKYSNVRTLLAKRAPPNRTVHTKQE